MKLPIVSQQARGRKFHDGRPEKSGQYEARRQSLRDAFIRSFPSAADRSFAGTEMTSQHRRRRSGMTAADAMCPACAAQRLA
jgi:hypothetical protein